MIEVYFQEIVIGWIVLGLILFPFLIKIRAPYGRHSNKSWGPMLDNRSAWIIMEIPSLALFTILFLTGDPISHGAKWFFLTFWLIHYFNRVFIFPIRTRTMGKKMPVLIMILAMLFNLINAFINGYWLGYMTPEYYIDWIRDPRFIIGVVLFVSGFLINQTADNHLIRLREKKSNSYSIPTSRLFKYISCPNFAGEILEWTGFAIMTWSFPGLSFALWTAVNLIPRAIHHHRWYKQTFSNYPKGRKAIIPGIL